MIINLKKFNPKLLKPVRDNLNYLFNLIGQKENIKEFNNLIFNEFEELKKKEFKKILSGDLTFSGSLSYKTISATENLKVLSAKLSQQLWGEYTPVENVKNNEYIEIIFKKYFPKMANLEIGNKIKILQIIERSLIEKKENGKISEWKQLCKGILKILNGEITPEKDKIIIVDIIVRISRWYKTTGNIWIGFLSYVDEIVKIIWGEIEDLYKKYSEDNK